MESCKGLFAHLVGGFWELMRFAMQPAQTVCSAWCNATLVESALDKGQSFKPCPNMRKP
jgi:short subunit fatty acids transporter